MYSFRETELAYISGIVDGEGCLSVKQHKGHSSSYTTHLTVEMRHKETIQWLYETVGGKMYTKSSPSMFGKASFTWTLSGKESTEFVKLLLPYLRTKREEAEIFIAFPYTNSRNIYPSQPLYNEINYIRGKISEQLKVLKRAYFVQL